MVADAAFVRPTDRVVLNAIAVINLEFSAVVLHRDLNMQFAVRFFEELAEVWLQIQKIGSVIELMVQNLHRIVHAVRAFRFFVFSVRVGHSRGPAYEPPSAHCSLTWKTPVLVLFHISAKKT